MRQYHLPVIPYSVIDAYNRKAAAVGSPRWAMLTSYANYNGHHLTVAYNTYRRYYTCEYYWAERVVLARGAFPDCLNAALHYYQGRFLGASVEITIPETDGDAIALCEQTTDIRSGSLWVQDEHDVRQLRHDGWYTWRHQVAVECPKDMANPGCPTLIFDWDLLQKADNRKQYEDLLKEKYGRVYS